MKTAEEVLEEIVHKISNINDCIEDEGDRVFLGSTNDRITLQEVTDVLWLWWLSKHKDDPEI